MSEITLLAEVTAFLRQPHGQFIAGQREAGRGAPFAVINPATGQAIAEVTAADSDQAERAMESARQAFSQWREMPTLARGALLLKLADTLAEHREALAQLEKVIGKQRFGELVGGMITKSPGKPALAAESDKRPAYNGAAADFSEVKAI